MAERRMFSARITTNSTRFLRLPMTAQCLYFHLGMQADDEGVVEAFITMRQVGASEDDLKALEAKGFIKILNEDLVSYISDWEESNQIRGDRVRQSIHHKLLVDYLNRKENSVEDSNVDNNNDSPQTQQNSVSADCQQSAADCPQNVSNLPQNVGELSADCQQSAAKCPPSIVEYSIGKDSIGEYTSSSRVSTNSEYTGPPVDKSTTMTASQPVSLTEKIKNKQFEQIVNLYQDCIHPIPNEVESDDLCSLYDEFGAEWLTEAIKAAARHRARSIAYVKSVLNNWASSGKNEPWKQQPKKPPAKSGNNAQNRNSAPASRSEKVAAMSKEAAEMIAAMGG